MKMIFPLFLMFFVQSLLTSGSVLNLAELSSVQYSVRIARDPVLENTEQGSEPSLAMVNMDGQKYTCSLPEIPDLNTNDNKTDDESNLDIEELLSPLESSPCMFLTKDWWTYEVCIKRYIKQYRVEGDVPVGAVILLGTHYPDEESMVDPDKPYHPQWYGNGSRCDINGQTRQTEVRFFCNEAATQEFIAGIIEHAVCEYTVLVHTSRLSGVERMRTTPGSSPDLPIVCHPVLDKDQMVKYNLFKEKSKLAKQLNKQQRKQEQSLKLVKQLGPRKRGVKTVATGIGATDGIMEMMGNKMMEKIINEVDTLLDVSLGIIASDDTNEDKNDQSSASSAVSADDQELKGEDGLIVENQVVFLASLQDLVRKRNILWDRIFEARKTLEQFESELMSTESRLFSIKQTEENVEMIAKLEMKWRSLEVAVRSIHGNIAIIESEAKSVTQRILMMKNKLKEGRLAIGASYQTDRKDKSKVHENKVQVEDSKPESATVVEVPSFSVLDQKETRTDKYESITEVTTIRAAKKDTSDEGLGGNIKISISKLSDDDDSEQSFDDGQSEKIVTKLEEIIKNKLSRHGLTKGGKPIEVKLITARLPEGAENEDDRQLNDMFYNMMTGDVEGYKDISQVRKDEENYGFAWREEMLTEMEQKIEKLKLSGAEGDMVDKMLQYAIDQDDDIKKFWESTMVKKSSERLDDLNSKNNIDENSDVDELVDDLRLKDKIPDTVVFSNENVMVDFYINAEEPKTTNTDSDVPDDKNGHVQDDPERKIEL